MYYNCVYVCVFKEVFADIQVQMKYKKRKLGILSDWKVFNVSNDYFCTHSAVVWTAVELLMKVNFSLSRRRKERDTNYNKIVPAQRHLIQVYPLFATQTLWSALVLLTENRGRAWRVHCSRRSTVSGSAGFRACSRKACSTTISTSCCRPCTVCSTRRPDTSRINSTNSSPVTSSSTWAVGEEETRSFHRGSNKSAESPPN